MILMMFAFENGSRTAYYNTVLLFSIEHKAWPITFNSLPE